MTDWAARFPELFRPRFEGHANVHLLLADAMGLLRA
jgi:hypothetical protein